jgi:16S rRNA (uracil1498-N3)-methyltransferase
LTQLQRLVIAPTQRQDQEISLTQAQQHYLVRVLRLGKNARFIAMDGQGSWWLSELDASLTQGKIIESINVQTELLVTVTLMAAMPKNGFDDIVTQATELGVSCIMPLKSDRTLLVPSPQKLQRWQRLSQEAAEQSERQIVPTILDPIDFTASLEMSATLATQRYLCVTRHDAPHLLSCLSNHKLQLKNQQPSSILIATGPEGGWTTDEVEQAIKAGFQAVSLGRRIFRAVTAPLVALSLVAASFEG